VVPRDEPLPHPLLDFDHTLARAHQVDRLEQVADHVPQDRQVRCGPHARADGLLEGRQVVE
jgi:hypothetical protein